MSGEELITQRRKGAKKKCQSGIGPLRLCAFARNCFLWVSRMLSEGDGTPSTKRVCFFITTSAAVGLCLGLFLRHGFEALAVDLMKWALTAAGTAYGITRLAEYGSDAGQPINNQPPPPTS